LVTPSGLLSRKLATNSKNEKEVQTSKVRGIFEPKTFLRRARQMKHTRKKSNGTKRHMLLLPVFLVAVVALILGAAAPNCWAEDSFDVADVYAELNDTDGDLGFHALIDGEAYKYLKIEDPRERNILNLSVRGRLRRQGLTELFFESAEPNFEDLTPEQFFNRFREGMYEIEAITLEGDELESEDLFRHVMPAPPDGITVSGQAMAPTCDEDDEDYDEELVPTIEAGEDVIIAWGEVNSSHPDIGDDGEIIPALYEVVVEAELVVDGEEFTSVYSVVLPPSQTSMTVPEEFIELSDEFKYEILVKEAEGGNQTAVESCFIVEE
jgi:hypothetical protein